MPGVTNVKDMQHIVEKGRVCLVGEQLIGAPHTPSVVLEVYSRLWLAIVGAGLVYCELQLAMVGLKQPP